MWNSVYFVVVLCILPFVFSQLVVKVKNNGGDTLRENIFANTTQDTVTVELQQTDGTFITQFIDFKNEIQIFRALVLGEEELGQSNYQVICFIIRFIKNEFISSDAMSKLRQKNPSAIRHPEDDKGREEAVLDLAVNLEHTHVISPYIASVCKEAPNSTYARDEDLKVLAKTLNRDYSSLLGATKKTPQPAPPRCKDTKDYLGACTCQFEICIGWYPCGLKYCRGKDSTKKVVSYRCGIKTCRKCRSFSFFSYQKQTCLWDDINSYALPVLNKIKQDTA